MRVVVVACRDNGDVDLDDLRAKVAEHARSAGGADDHLSVHARRVRARHRRHLRGGARRRRSGVRRRRQPQRPGRAGPAGQVRRRRQPSQPAQDVLHPARWRRTRRRAGRGALAPGRRTCRAIRWPTSSPTSHTVSAAPYGSASILPITWAYIRMMGAARAARRDADGDRVGQLHRPPARRVLPGALHRRERHGRPRVHPRSARDHQEPPA